MVGDRKVAVKAVDELSTLLTQSGFIGLRVQLFRKYPACYTTSEQIITEVYNGFKTSINNYVLLFARGQNKCSPSLFLSRLFCGFS